MEAEEREGEKDRKRKKEKERYPAGGRREKGTSVDNLSFPRVCVTCWSLKREKDVVMRSVPPTVDPSCSPSEGNQWQRNDVLPLLMPLFANNSEGWLNFENVWENKRVKMSHWEISMRSRRDSPNTKFWRCDYAEISGWRVPKILRSFKDSKKLPLSILPGNFKPTVIQPTLYLNCGIVRKEVRSRE